MNQIRLLKMYPGIVMDSLIHSSKIHSYNIPSMPDFVPVSRDREISSRKAHNPEEMPDR